jgi:hypothetical protein
MAIILVTEKLYISISYVIHANEYLYHKVILMERNIFVSRETKQIMKLLEVFQQSNKTTAADAAVRQFSASLNKMTATLWQPA